MHHCIPLGYTALFRELTTNMTSILGANNMLNFIHLIREGDVDKHIFDLQSVHRGMHTSRQFYESLQYMFCFDC